MEKYCLCYDAKKASEWPGDSLKRAIVAFLIEKGIKDDTISNPVASTLTFEDSTSDRFTYWGNAIALEFSTKIYFYLSMIAKDKYEIYLEKQMADEDLEKHFKKMLESI